MRASWFLVLVFGFTAGIALRSFIDLGVYFSLFFASLGVVLLFIFLLKKERSVFYVSLAVLAVASGMIRFDLSDRDQGEPLLDARVDSHVSIEGIVSEEPDKRIGKTNLVIDVIQLTENGETYPIKTRARITTEPYPSFTYGDRIAVSGEILLPKGFENEDTGKFFDYGAYLAKDGIFYQFIRPEIIFIGADNGNGVKRYLLTLKHAFLENVSRLISEPESSLLGGLLVGAKQSLGEELLDDFRTVGVIHIVVLSGYNLTIVAEAISKFFSFAPRLWGLSLGGIAIILFSIMTGAGATVVRASLMALLALLARATGRIYEITLALLLAGFIMLMYNPKILVFDPSFQLSFVATLGLIHFAPAFEKFFLWVPRRFGLRDVVSATLATQIAVLPLLLFMTGSVSLVSLPANIFILPLIPLTMLFGFLAGMFGFLGPMIAFPFALVAHLFLSYELAVVEYASCIPLAAVEGLAIGPIFLFLLYIILFVSIFALVHRKRA